MQGHYSADSRVIYVSAEGKKELKLSIPAVNSYCSAINYIFSLAGTDLVANRINHQDVQQLQEDKSTLRGSATRMELILVFL